MSKFALPICIALSVLTPQSVVAAGNAKHAAIVVDANTGKVLYGSDADAPRHPASLTKMMTLYMVFEALANGKINKNSQIIMSKHAASMPPTKLGVRAGNSITVETAILALVTKSANDAAAATAEFLGGSEQNFALMMTAKARRLGMKNSRFYNASGLPDARQLTTARDMATLGMALRQNFPQYYSYFSTRSFTYGRSRMANHNKLLGRVAGVDGIKTGYTRSSGFNLVSSVALGKKRVVSVVLGGKSGRSRDAEMAKLISKFMPKASNTRTNGGALLAMRTIFNKKSSPIVDDPLQDLAVIEDAANNVVEAKQAAKAKFATTKGDALAFAHVKPAQRPIVPLTTEIEDNAGTDDVATVDPITTASAPPLAEEISSQAVSGAWVIQIAAADSNQGALKILNSAKAKGGKALSFAEPFTQSVQKGSATLYRARFGGFSTKAQALSACAALKKKNYGCFALVN